MICMQGIEILLKRYAALKPRDMVVKDAFRMAFIDVFGKDVVIPELTVTNSILRVNVSGPLKSELLIRKDEIEKTFLIYLEKGLWFGEIR